MAKQPSMESLKAFVRTEGRSYLKIPNVTSVGIGYKVTAGEFTKQLSIQFTVGNKVAPEALEALSTEELPKSINIDGVEVPTDVLERSYEKSVRAVTAIEAPGRKTVINPIVPGVSIAHRDISAGTAGCVVYDAKTNAPYVLSNWHVLHGAGGEIGDPIVQPGRHDDNRVTRNVAGRLVRSHLGAAGDCAIASIDQRQLASEIFDLNVAVQRIGEPELGDKVVKSGRTTDVTYGRVQRVHIMVTINYDKAGDREIGCFEIGPDPDKPAVNGEISMGGDSGSAWLSVDRGRATSLMVGLHFAGETGNAPEHALACYAASVFEKLEIRPQPRAEILREDTSDAGFAINFLGETVDLPQPANDEVRNDLVPTTNNGRVHYMHFSLAMSKSRRLCRWVAWNIDGDSLKSLSRRGLNFVKDSAIPAKYQVGNELYVNNPLDRGHLARRADLCWGPRAEAEQANKDSFYYSNITPQHEDFNQSSAGGIWGQLENGIFADADVENLKVSVIGGPIFQDDDGVYRGVLLPRDFWKIIYFRDGTRGALMAKAYRLTQKDLINGLEAFELPQFAVYEVPIPQIAEVTQLRLPVPGTSGQALRGRRHAAEALEEARVRRIDSVDQIVS